jgi:hypothetical protein
VPDPVLLNDQEGAGQSVQGVHGAVTITEGSVVGSQNRVTEFKSRFIIALPYDTDAN